MKDKDIYKAVAELAGIYFGPSESDSEKCWRHENGGKYVLSLPPYLTSRDAIIPAIEKVCNTNAKQMYFSSWLHIVLKLRLMKDRDCWFYFVTATPAQLAEALLRATGKWKD